MENKLRRVKHSWPHYHLNREKGWLYKNLFSQPFWALLLVNSKYILSFPQHFLIIYFLEILIAPFVKTAHLRPPAQRPCLLEDLASNVVTSVDSVVFLAPALINASFVLRHEAILREVRDVLENAKQENHYVRDLVRLNVKTFF